MSWQAARIAAALGGHRSGDGFLVRCPVPGHGKGRGDRRPSLSVKDGETCLLVQCFAGCDSRDVLDALIRGGLMSENPARPIAPALRGPASAPTIKPDRKAKEVWRSAVAVDQTLAARYLQAHRHLTPPFPLTLRFTPAAFHPRHRLILPALVAAVQAPDRRLTAVQLTFLQGSGDKASLEEPRWTHGPLGEGAVRLGTAGDVLGIAEGVEDALAASQLSQLSCWACIGAGRMHRVLVPDAVRELHIFADDDEPGRKAAERTAQRHQESGRRVVVRLPPRGFKDWGAIAARSGDARAA